MINPEEPYGGGGNNQTHIEGTGVEVYSPAEVRKVMFATNEKTIGTFRLLTLLMAVVMILMGGTIIALGIYAASAGNCETERVMSDLPSVWEEISPKGPQPHARLAHAATSDGGFHMYVHGGFYGTGDPIFNDLWMYDEREDSWTQLETTGDVPTPRLHHTIVMADGHTIILFGGFNYFQGHPSHDSLDDMYRLDLRTLVWQRITIPSGPQPSKRGAHDAFFADGAMFVFGGFPAIGPTGHFEEMWKFYPSQQRWENLTPANLDNFPDGRIGFAFAVYDSTHAMLYGGGCPPTSPESQGGQCDDVWIYNFRANTWERRIETNAPLARRATHADVAFFGLVYLFGGVNIVPVDGTPVATMLDDLWVYDPAQDLWMRLHPNFNRGAKPPKSFGHSVVALGTKMVVFGGRVAHPSSPGSNQLWEYHVIPPV